MPIKLREAVIAGAIAAVAAVASSLLTAAFTYTSRNKELDIELVKVGIGILRADPKEAQTQGAREWAIQIIEQHSGQKFSAEAKSELLAKSLGYVETLGRYGEPVGRYGEPDYNVPYPIPQERRPPKSSPQSK
jgi:hypothetical protein